MTLTQAISRTTVARLARSWKRLRDERATSLIEVALILALLGPPMLLGTAEVAGFIYASIEVANAAHAGAAFAAATYIQNSNTSLPTAAQVTSAAQNDAPELMNMLSPGTNLSVSMATGCNGAAATSGNSIPSCSTGVMSYVQVTAQATVAPFAGLLPGALTVNNRAVINLVN